MQNSKFTNFSSPAFYFLGLDFQFNKCFCYHIYLV